MRVSVVLIPLLLSLGPTPKQSPDADWRHKVVLFQSRKADVEKLLGRPVGEPDGGTYRLNDGILYLDYYGFDHCKARYGFKADWNLPEWTVIEIEYRPTEEAKFSDLHLDLHKFRNARLSPGTPDLI